MIEKYEKSLDLIYDELLVVDLLLHVEVLKFRARNDEAENLQKFKGLFISDEEIDKLLSGEKINRAWSKKTSTDDPNIQSLIVSIENLGDEIGEKIDIARKDGLILNLANLVTRLGLSPSEAQILSICLAPEVDVKYRKIFSYLQNDVTKKHPTVDLLLSLVSSTFEQKIEARDYLSPQSKLFKNNVLEYIDDELDANKPLLSKEIKVNTRIAGYVMGSTYVDDKLAPIATLYYPDHDLEGLIMPEEVKDQLSNFIKYYNEAENFGEMGINYVFSFFGSYGSDKREAAGVLCKQLAIPLLVVDLEAAYNMNFPFEKIIELAMRESSLFPAALYFRNSDFIFSNDEQQDVLSRKIFLDALNNDSWLTFISSNDPLSIQGELSDQKFIEVSFPVPDYGKRKDLWSQYLEDYTVAEDLDIRDLAGKFNFTSGQVREAVITASNKAFWRSPDDCVITMRDLFDACHIHSNQRLKNLAQQVRPKYAWDDIILSEEQQDQLREIVTNMKYKHIVYDEWGFDKKLALGKGFSALFYGPPGTGKTMAADIIANELQIDLFKIDLSTVVSKYIGETEKNLNKIFTEAETSNAILFFDEADALFGKRTDVKDSHDRYANIEVGYLLQKMDEYRGVVILASNFKKNMDDAFARRLQFSINFPFPEEESRIRIWKGIFPKETPLRGEIDYEFMSKKLKISGGNIKNIALAAAFYAADDTAEYVSMDHVIQGCKREFQKIGRSWELRDILREKERDDKLKNEAEDTKDKELVS